MPADAEMVVSMSLHARTFTPLIATIESPCCSPACAAGIPTTTESITAGTYERP